MNEPLNQQEVRRLIREILANGVYWTSSHAQAEMRKDGLTELDVVNVLRGGVVEPGEWENGSWRYQLRTQRIVVVVAFDSETELSVVTAWRNQK